MRVFMFVVLVALFVAGVSGCSSSDDISGNTIQAAPLLSGGRGGNVDLSGADGGTGVPTRSGDGTGETTGDRAGGMSPDGGDEMTEMTGAVMPSRAFSFTTAGRVMYEGAYDGEARTCVVQGMMVEASNVDACEQAFEAAYQDEIERFEGSGRSGMCRTYGGATLTCSDRRCRTFSGISGGSCSSGRSLEVVSGAVAAAVAGTESSESLGRAVVGRLSLGASFGDAVADTDRVVMLDDVSLGGLDGFIDRQRDDRLESWLQGERMDSPLQASVAVTRAVRVWAMRGASSMQSLAMAGGMARVGMDDGRFSLPYMGLVGDDEGFVAGGLRYERAGHRLSLVLGQGDGRLVRKGGSSVLVTYGTGDFVGYVGVVWENERALGTRGFGALALNGQSATTFASLQRTFVLAEGWQAVASMAMGRTRMAMAIDRGLVRGLDVLTSAFAVQLLGDAVMEQGDSVVVRVGQPLRVEGGAMNVAGTDLDMTPSGRTLEMGVGYGVSLGAVEVKVGVDYVWDGGHVRGGSDDLLGMVVVQRDF
ncbi:MAG: hypothetical protein GDA50_07150 [Alphaproteobacteria bacterium GM202ARS2]|nr:hypothetical protein [Alphaproteobacteria bacterium GM202ARS2]